MTTKSLKVGNTAQELTERIESAFSDALAALIAQRDQQYDAETAALDAERTGLLAEYETISQAIQDLADVLPAKARMASFAADALLVEGKVKESRAQREAQQDAEKELPEMGRRQQEIVTRVEEIDEKKRAVAKAVFGACYSEAQSVVRAGEKGHFITLLNGLESSFYEYQKRTDTFAKVVGQISLVTPRHIERLTADEHSREWIVGQKWYRGRQ